MSARPRNEADGEELTVTLRCPPELEGRIPKPELASRLAPEWLARMPAQAASEVLGGMQVRTVKQCPPFVDAVRCGILFRLSADIIVRGGELEWDWDVPALASSPVTLAPLGVHLPEQVSGTPLAAAPGRFVIKFTNYWTVGLPAGWSMLFDHPFNRTDLPFRTLSGLVDCDSYASNFVHFPALWTDDGFEGVLARGTPVAQGLPVRRASISLDRGAFDDGEVARHLEVQADLGESTGVYRRDYRAPKTRSRRR